MQQMCTKVIPEMRLVSLQVCRTNRFKLRLRGNRAVQYDLLPLGGTGNSFAAFKVMHPAVFEQIAAASSISDRSHYIWIVVLRTAKYCSFFLNFVEGLLLLYH